MMKRSRVQSVFLQLNRGGLTNIYSELFGNLKSGNPDYSSAEFNHMVLIVSKKAPARGSHTAQNQFSSHYSLRLMAAKTNQQLTDQFSKCLHQWIILLIILSTS